MSHLLIWARGAPLDMDWVGSSFPMTALRKTDRVAQVLRNAIWIVTLFHLSTCEETPTALRKRAGVNP
jgi:hypothetical protein